MGLEINPKGPASALKRCQAPIPDDRHRPPNAATHETDATGAELYRPFHRLKRPSSGFLRPFSGLNRPGVLFYRPALGLQRPSICLVRPHAGRERPLGQLDRPDAELKRPFGHLYRPCARLKRPLLGSYSPFIALTALWAVWIVRLTAEASHFVSPTVRFLVPGAPGRG